MRTLYQFPLSHYCEKARWMLDFKELEYNAVNLIPGVHRILTRWKTSKNTLPMLRDGDIWISHSSEIALYLDGQYPECPLLKRDPVLRSTAIEIEQKANELGKWVRRWAYIYLIHHPSVKKIMLGERGPIMNQINDTIWPGMKKGVISLYGIHPSKAERALGLIHQLVDELEHHLLSGPGNYMVGEDFGLADIAVCSMIAPLLWIPGTPWENTGEDEMPEATVRMRDELLARPIGQYVSRCYRDHRNAQIDWHGQY